MVKASLSIATCFSLFCLVSGVWADAFGNGENSFEIEFIPIGDPGNPADTTGEPSLAGSVDYVFEIGKYEITRGMVEAANAEGGLGITMADMTSFGGNGPDKPASGLTWIEAANFVNWLNSNSGGMNAYKIDGTAIELWQEGDRGYDVANPLRNSLATYFLPNIDEWYKAAFYDPHTGTYFDFPTGSDSPPVPVANGNDPGTAVYDQSVWAGLADVTQAGGPSPYGTVGQGGNIWEWQETQQRVDRFDQSWHYYRGGEWVSEAEQLSSAINTFATSTIEIAQLGFRVARTWDSVAGDFDGDGVLSAADIAVLTEGILNESSDAALDVDMNGTVDLHDHATWVKELKYTWFGDADLDGEFGSGDLVTVFEAGKYEQDQLATWSDGDWNADGRFGSGDLVKAFEDGGYEQGPRPATSAVPEPSIGLLVALAAMFTVPRTRRKRLWLTCVK